MLVICLGSNSLCVFNYIIITFIVIDFTLAGITNTDSESHLSIQDEGALDGNNDSRPGSKQQNDDDDDVDVDGPRVEAHVDLSKIACKYIFSSLNIVEIYQSTLQCAKFSPKTLKLNNSISPISSRILSTTSSIQMIAPIAVVFRPSLHFLA